MKRSAGVVVVLLALLGGTGAQAAGKAGGSVTIKVLSNRADLVSAGDALVELIGEGKAASLRKLKVTVGTRDVTSAFELRPNGRVQGLLEGLAVGPNVLTARADGGGGQITITNHPSGGPVFAGPQITPWRCSAGAVDAQCNRPAAYSYLYMPSGGGGFLAYDPQNPPSDVGTTTTDQGKTVPFIVRLETGSLDRGQYKIVVLFDPTQGWQPWAPQPAWNRKLFMTHGAGCGTAYSEGGAPEVLDAGALGRGFLVMSTSLNNTGHNCNMIVQAESQLMAKERVIERYGPIRYSFGTGGSGGALVQQWIANAYPGIYDGLTLVMSFPDAWTPMTEIEDCALLLRYFDDPTQWGVGAAWNEAQEAAVAGHPSTSVCRTWVTVYNFPPLFEPSGTCVSAGQVYNEQTNPKGVRCTLWDYARSIVGLRPSDGFANRPLDNVGVMYGLQALQRGLITPAQFVDLNGKIGSHDIDYDWQPSRAEADLPALQAVYQSGLDNQGNNMDSVPVLDMRGPSPEIHHQYRSWSMRARLDRSNGNHDNQIIWYGPVAVIGDNTFGGQWFDVMDRWLAAIEADTSSRTIEQKVVADKPADAHDRCTDGVTGNEAPACVLPFDESPRMGAGEPLTDDIFKCTLKPLNQGDYFGLVPFTADQWAQLQAAFPNGVCDFSKPGVAQKPTVAWLTYQDGPGGKPLGPPPVSKPLS